MPTPLRYRCFLVPGALLGGLLVGLAGFGVSQQGDTKAPAAKDARPGVFALLHVHRRPPRILGDGPQAPLDPGEPEEFRRTQLVILRTRAVLNNALRDPAVNKLPVVQQQTDAVAWLEKHLHTEYLDGTGMLRLSLRTGNPKEQAALVNAVADAYLREAINKANGQKLQRLNRLKKLYTEYDSLLSGKRETLRNMTKALGSGDAKILNRKQQLVLSQLNDLQTELLRVQSQLRRAQVELKILEKHDKGAPPEAAIKELIEKDEVVARLRTEVSKMEESIAKFKARAATPESWPEYKRAIKRLEASTRALAARRDLLRPDAVAEARAQAGAGKRAGRARLKDKTEFLKALERELTEDMERRAKEITNAKRDMIDVEWLRQEIAEAEAVAREIARQKQRLEVEIEAPLRVQLIEHAVAPK